MENFLISPEDCLVLKAFKESSSLREAAKILNCDPAGLARRVQHISSQHGLLQKVNNRWQLASRGLDLVAWVEDSMQSQRRTLLQKSSLRIASTMWFAEEVLIPGLIHLQEVFGKERVFSISTPGKDFERVLIDGSVDFVVVCHPPETPEIEHKQLQEEEWTLIAPFAWRKFLTGSKEEQLAQLKKRPFVRHGDLNPDLMLPGFHDEIQDSVFTVDSVIGVRSAVEQGLGWSLIPRVAEARLIQSKSLLEIPWALPLRDRKVCVWWLRNRRDSKKQSEKICQWVRSQLG